MNNTHDIEISNNTLHKYIVDGNIKYVKYLLNNKCIIDSKMIDDLLNKYTNWNSMRCPRDKHNDECIIHPARECSYYVVDG